MNKAKNIFSLIRGEGVKNDLYPVHAVDKDLKAVSQPREPSRKTLSVRDQLSS